MVGGQKDSAAALKRCDKNVQDGTKIRQRIGSLKGCQVKTVMDNDGMSVFYGIDKDDCKVPPCNISGGRI
jgi:hypothetical protein